MRERKGLKKYVKRIKRRGTKRKELIRWRRRTWMRWDGKSEEKIVRRSKE